jgi:molybdopterin molybdotransferase
MPALRAVEARTTDTVDVAREKMLSGIVPLAAELIDLPAAAGRTLAESVRAVRAQPPFRSAAMDGYAVRAADLALGKFTVLDEVPAGKAAPDVALGAGDALRIFTGAPVPATADFIVPQERARREGTAVWLEAAAPLRHNIRAAGIDFTAGEVLIPQGTRLHARHLALIAAAGFAAVRVARRPRIALCATGNELVQPGTRAAAHQIFDSVSFGLGAMVEAWGAQAVRLAIQPDAHAAIAGAVGSALPEADLMVIIGGASVGDYDLVKESLATLGLAIHVPRIAIRPGKPTWFGSVGGKPILGLAGNPAAALVCAHLFLRPLIRALVARTSATDPVPALLDGELPESGANEWYLRARAGTDAEARLRVRPFDNQDTSLVSVLAAANALIRRPAGAGAVGNGAIVEVLWLE